MDTGGASAGSLVRSGLQDASATRRRHPAMPAWSAPTEQATLVVTALPNPAEMPTVLEYLSGMVLVMDFDSADAIKGMFESDEYAALIDAGTAGSRR
jgi:hypothetical protein